MLAWLGMKSLLAVNPEVIPRIELVRIDATVALVTLGVALLTGLLFGLAPALLLARYHLDRLTAGERDRLRGLGLDGKSEHAGSLGTKRWVGRRILRSSFG